MMLEHWHTCCFGRFSFYMLLT